LIPAYQRFWRIYDGENSSSLVVADESSRLVIDVVENFVYHLDSMDTTKFVVGITSYTYSYAWGAVRPDANPTTRR
jgi:hypothetical protein